jgi:hypothetical protein
MNPILSIKNPAGHGGAESKNKVVQLPLYPGPKTVQGRVLADLLIGRTITHKDCWVEHGSSRLAMSIFHLRQKGWNIFCTEKPVATSDCGRIARIGYYSLPGPVIESAGAKGMEWAEATLQAERNQRAA